MSCKIKSIALQKFKYIMSAEWSLLTEIIWKIASLMNSFVEQGIDIPQPFWLHPILALHQYWTNEALG